MNVYYVLLDIALTYSTMGTWFCLVPLASTRLQIDNIHNWSHFSHRLEPQSPPPSLIWLVRRENFFSFVWQRVLLCLFKSKNEGVSEFPILLSLEVSLAYKIIQQCYSANATVGRECNILLDASSTQVDISWIPQETPLQIHSNTLRGSKCFFFKLKLLLSLFWLFTWMSNHCIACLLSCVLCCPHKRQ